MFILPDNVSIIRDQLAFDSTSSNGIVRFKWVDPSDLLVPDFHLPLHYRMYVTHTGIGYKGVFNESTFPRCLSSEAEDTDEKI